MIQNERTIIEGRKDALDTIAHTLMASKKVKLHPLLIGKTGVGKTETVKSFVKVLEKGIYSTLKGKRVFYFNAADLVKDATKSGTGGKILYDISRVMGRHRENIILVFDEIHLVCKKGPQEIIGEQLKTLLDDNTFNFPHVIGITTEEEYYRDIYRNNAAFARRFKRINIDNTKDRETYAILSSYLLKQAPQTIIEDGALEYLVDKTKDSFPDTTQPAAAIKILSLCINQTKEAQPSLLETKIRKIREKIHYFYSRSVVGEGCAWLVYSENKTQELRDKLKHFKQELRKKKDELAALAQGKESLVHLKAEMYRLALTLQSIQESDLSRKSKLHVNTFLLLSHFLVPILDSYIRTFSQSIGAKTIVNAALIDEIIQAELENNKKVQESIDRGKQQLKNRSEA